MSREAVAVFVSLFLFASPAVAAGDGAGDIGVRVAGACPSAASFVKEVQPLLPGRRLTLLTPGEPTVLGGETVELTSTPEGRALLLRSGRGDITRREPLPSELGCEGAAREAAVLLAAWEFQGEASPGPATTASRNAPPAEQAPVAAPVTVARTSASGAAGRGSSSSSLWLGTTLLTSFVGERPSWGLAGEALLGPQEGPALHVALAALSEATVAVGGGDAAWSRAWLGVGGAFTVAHGRWSFAVAADLVGGFFSIAGEGFRPNQRGTQAAVGASSGLRVAWGSEAARLWLGPQLLLWPGRHTVVLAGSDVSRDLPSFEALLSLGVDFLVWR